MLLHTLRRNAHKPINSPLTSGLWQLENPIKRKKNPTMCHKNWLISGHRAVENISKPTRVVYDSLKVCYAENAKNPKEDEHGSVLVKFMSSEAMCSHWTSPSHTHGDVVSDT